MKPLPIACSMTENIHSRHIDKGLIFAIIQKGITRLLTYEIHLHARHQMLATSSGEEVRE